MEVLYILSCYIQRDTWFGENADRFGKWESFLALKYTYVSTSTQLQICHSPQVCIKYDTEVTF